MILADTSVWVDHLRNRDPEMEKYLTRGQILMHPFIVAELSLGSLRNRQKTLADMDALLEARVATLDEAHMIEAHTLIRRALALRTRIWLRLV